MATHSGILAWRIPGMGAWWAVVRGHKESDTTDTTQQQQQPQFCCYKDRK